MKEFKIEIVTATPMLGTLSGNKELAEEFILSKHPDGLSKEEVMALHEANEEIEKRSTFFPRKDGCPIIWDYQIKGFFKSAAEVMTTTGDYSKEVLKKFRLTPYLYKKTINTLLMVYPRAIVLNLPGKQTSLEFLERPLRGQTMQGERISLARSEVAPAGTSFEFKVTILNDSLEEWLPRWLDYGGFVGLLQWRTASFGRFDWSSKDLKRTAAA